MNMPDHKFANAEASASFSSAGYPSYFQLLERAMVIAGIVLACVLFMGIVTRPSVIANPVTTSVATAGLWLGSILAGLLFAGKNDRASVVGLALGLPLGYFYFQNAYARAASIQDLSQGSARILAVSGALAVISGVISWFWRRHQRKNSISSSVAATL